MPASLIIPWLAVNTAAMAFVLPWALTLAHVHATQEAYGKAIRAL